MILIDALYINQGGGLRLLNYLVKSLLERRSGFYLLADKRCEGMFDYIDYVEYIEASMINRYKYYKAHQNTYSKILCFGNVPPPIKINTKVYTYLHNINILNQSGSLLLKNKIRNKVKRMVIKNLKNHTDKWIVQTENTKTEFLKHLSANSDEVLVLPFFELPVHQIGVSSMRRDYALIGDYNYGNRGHEQLLEAWRILKGIGFNQILHITLDKSKKDVQRLEKDYNFKDLNIINHGLVGFDTVLRIYAETKAIVYPSRNESLGLSVIEAINYGCDVIGADLPYTYSVCKPSVAFNPLKPKSIVEAVEKYESNKCPKSELLINNKIEELLELLEA